MKNAENRPKTHTQLSGSLSMPTDAPATKIARNLAGNPIATALSGRVEEYEYYSEDEQAPAGPPVVATPVSTSAAEPAKLTGAKRSRTGEPRPKAPAGPKKPRKPSAAQQKKAAEAAAAAAASAPPLMLMDPSVPGTMMGMAPMDLTLMRAPPPPVYYQTADGLQADLAKAAPVDRTKLQTALAMSMDYTALIDAAAAKSASQVPKYYRTLGWSVPGFQLFPMAPKVPSKSAIAAALKAGRPAPETIYPPAFNPMVPETIPPNKNFKAREEALFLASILLQSSVERDATALDPACQNYVTVAGLANFISYFAYRARIGGKQQPGTAGTTDGADAELEVGKSPISASVATAAIMALLRRNFLSADGQNGGLIEAQADAAAAAAADAPADEAADELAAAIEVAELEADDDGAAPAADGSKGTKAKKPRASKASLPVPVCLVNKKFIAGARIADVNDIDTGSAVWAHLCRFFNMSQLHALLYKFMGHSKIAVAVPPSAEAYAGAVNPVMTQLRMQAARAVTAWTDALGVMQNLNTYPGQLFVNPLGEIDRYRAPARPKPAAAASAGADAADATADGTTDGTPAQPAAKKGRAPAKPRAPRKGSKAAQAAAAAAEAAAAATTEAAEPADAAPMETTNQAAPAPQATPQPAAPVSLAERFSKSAPAAPTPVPKPAAAPDAPAGDDEYYSDDEEGGK